MIDVLIGMILGLGYYYLLFGFGLIVLIVLILGIAGLVLNIWGFFIKEERDVH